MVVVLSIVSVVVVGLIVYVFVLRPPSGTGGGTASATTVTTLGPDDPGTTLPEATFATFTSPSQGFSVKYPKDWAYISDDGGITLDAGGAGDAVDIRLLERTEIPTTVDNLVNIKAFTDGIVGSNKSAVILKQQPIVVNGMPGYYYLYTFTEAETGAQGAHAHYFLFRGRNMYTLIFQALPQEGFARLSRVFDQMAESFQTQPDTGPAETTPTTAG
ncbi:MAG: PsbP-like protein [Actinomycetota bacterium]|nr:PsbP-like protein [Actinomycetota bacterium]